MTKIPKNKKQKHFWILSTVNISLILTYLFFVGFAMNNTFAAQEAESEIASITSDVSGLEFKYLNAKSKVNPELARNLGFIDPEKIIVAKESETALLTPKIK